DQAVHFWDAATGKQLEKSFKQETPVTAVAFSPDGKLLAAGGEGKVTVWDAESGKRLHQLAGHTGPVLTLAFAADHKTLASAASDGVSLLWDAPAGRKLDSPQPSLVPNPNRRVLTAPGLDFAPDGRLLVSATNEQLIRLWDPATGKAVRTLQAPFSVTK